jgi:DNA-binding beta-propeller fold protein YncE
VNCIHELPDLVRLEDKYPNQLVILGIHTPKFDSEKDPESIRKAMDRYGVRHPVLNDAERKVWMRYNVQSWPTTVLIDPEGNFVGGLNEERVFDALDKAIGQQVRIHRARKTLDEKPLPFRTARALRPGDGPLYFPGKVLADPEQGRLFIADSGHNRVVITDRDGKTLAVAGTGAAGRTDGPFDTARFADPQGLALKGETLYVADRKNHLIRALDLKEKTVKTVAGTGVQSRLRQGGPALRTGLNSPWDLYVHENLLFIAMAGNHQIWALDLARKRVVPFAGTGFENIQDGPNAASCFAQPSGLAGDETNLYVADSEVSAVRAVALDGSGVRTLVGTGLFDFGDRDGTGSQVRLQHALGVVCVDHLLYVADTFNHKIKVLDPRQGSCATFVGGSADRPLFHEPGGISHADGKLYVADTNAHGIRVVDLKTREVATLELHDVPPPRTDKDKP